MRKFYAEGVRIRESRLPVMTTPDAPDINAIAVSQPNSRKGRRKMFRRLPFGYVPTYAPYCMDSNDPETIEDAFVSRVGNVPPQVGRAVYTRLAAFVRAQVQDLPRVDITKIDFESWLSSRQSYNEQRKQQIRTCYQELKGGEPTRKQCSSVKCFVKSESYPEAKHARMIMSRSDHFKAWAGPYVSAMEDIVYSHCPEFIKHTPVPERPAKVRCLKRDGRIYYQTDFTKFESHFIRPAMDAIENVLYSHLLQDWSGLPTLLAANRGQNKLSTRTGVHARILARRMSGDLWTSLGNGFTNLMLAKFIAHEKGGSLEGFVEGDDGIFSSTVPLTADDYLRLGWTIKINEISDPCKGSFCGLIFGDSGQIIRDYRKFLENFGWTQSFINAGDKIMHQLLRAKALSTVYETPHCPIVGVLARIALEETKGVVPRFVDDGYHVPPDSSELPDFAPTADTRCLFAEMFSISVADQLTVEEAISKRDMGRVAELLPSSNSSLESHDLAWYEARFVIET